MSVSFLKFEKLQKSQLSLQLVGNLVLPAVYVGGSRPYGSDYWGSPHQYLEAY